jgi:hypothetical protein
MEEVLRGIVIRMGKGMRMRRKMMMMISWEMKMMMTINSD